MRAACFFCRPANDARGKRNRCLIAPGRFPRDVPPRLVIGIIGKDIYTCGMRGTLDATKDALRASTLLDEKSIE